MSLLAPVLLGLVFVGVRHLLDVVSTFEMVTIRFALIVLAFGTTLVAFKGTRPAIPSGRWRLVVYAGFVGVPASQFGVVHAQNFLARALAAVLIALAPAVTAILAPLLLNEKVTRRQAVGSTIAFAGAVVVIVVGAGEDATFDVSSMAGAAVGLVTPVAWALYTLALKQMAGDPTRSGPWASP